MPEIKAYFLDVSRYFKPEESILIHPHSYNCNFDIVHYHNFYELVAVRHGSGQHMTKDGTYSIYPGDVFLIRPGDPHGYCNMRQMELINLLYRPELLQELMEDLTKLPDTVISSRPTRSSPVNTGSKTVSPWRRTPCSKSTNCQCRCTTSSRQEKLAGSS
ncbi:MAG: AraC family ligand binding domain-containing protein [Victivallales bacterium]